MTTAAEIRRGSAAQCEGGGGGLTPCPELQPSDFKKAGAQSGCSWLRECPRPFHPRIASQWGSADKKEGVYPSQCWESDIVLRRWHRKHPVLMQGQLHLGHVQVGSRELSVATMAARQEGGIAVSAGTRVAGLFSFFLGGIPTASRRVTSLMWQSQLSEWHRREGEGGKEKEGGEGPAGTQRGTSAPVPCRVPLDAVVLRPAAPPSRKAAGETWLWCCPRRTSTSGLRLQLRTVQFWQTHWPHWMSFCSWCCSAVRSCSWPPKVSVKKREAQYLASAQSPSTHDSDWQSEFIEHFWPAHTGSRDAQGGRPTPAALAIAECPGRQGCGSRTRQLRRPAHHSSRRSSQSRSHRSRRPSPGRP